jgi:hypothetical protein
MQNFKIVSSFLSAAIFLAAYFPYFRDIFKKRTTPHAYTWLIWAITQGTAVLGLWYGKGGIGTLGLAVSEIFVIIIFFLSLKYGTRNITVGDTIAFVAALLAIVVWWQLDQPLFAILMVSAIDALAYIPSYRKTWEEPWSETLISWALFLTGDIFAIAALTEYNTLTVAYLTTLILCNIIFVILCLFRRNKIANPFSVSKQ